MATAGAKDLSQDSSRFCHVVWILLFFSLEWYLLCERGEEVTRLSARLSML